MLNSKNISFWSSINNVFFFRKWQQCQLFFSQEHLGHILRITWTQQSRHIGISASRWLECLCSIHLEVNLTLILFLGINGFFVFHALNLNKLLNQVNTVRDKMRWFLKLVFYYVLSLSILFGFVVRNLLCVILRLYGIVRVIFLCGHF